MNFILLFSFRHCDHPLNLFFTLLTATEDAHRVNGTAKVGGADEAEVYLLIVFNLATYSFVISDGFYS